MTGITYRSDLTRNLSASEVDGNFLQLTQNKVETSVYSALAASVLALAAISGASAGTTQLTAGTLVFGNSNGVSFGLDGATLTATVKTDYLTTAAQSGHSHGNPTLALTNLSGSTASNSAGLTLSLSAAPPGAGAAISAAGSSQSGGTIVFSNSNGMSFGMNGSTVTAAHNALTTAAQSDHSHGNPTLALTNLSGTTASASNGLTISLSAAAPGAGGGVAAAAGTQTGTIGTINFADSNGIAFGMSGSSQITASYTVPSTAGLLSAVKISAGSTSNNLSALTFANGNGVTFGLDGSTITASVAAVGGAQTGISGIGNSQTTYSSGTVGFSELGAITIRSTTGNQFQFSVAAQSVQTQGSVAILGSTGAISFANSNGITFGANASTITASHNGLTSQSGQAVSAGNGSSAFQTLGMVDAGGITWSTVGGGLQGSVKTDYLTTAAVSNHSHGDPTLALTNLSGTTASASNGLTLSLSAAAPVAQTAQTMGVYASSQTFGQSSSSTVDARSLSFLASGGLSIGMSAGSILFSAQTTAAQTAFVLSNSNNVSFGTNGSTVTASASFPAQTVQTQSNVQGISAGTQVGRTGDIVFANSNGMSFGMSGSSQITGSYTVPSVAGLLSAIKVSGGTTSNNLSAITFGDGNGVSFGMDGSVMTASVAAVAGAQTGISGLANSEATYTSGTVGFSALGALTIRSTTGQQFQFSVNAQTAQTQSNIAGIYDGAASVSTGTLRVSNANGISFGINGQTLTASHDGITSQTVQTQSNVQGLILSDTTYRTGDVSFSNGNGVSFGSSGANVITISHGLQFTSATSAITSNALHTSASRVMNIVAATNNTGGGTASLSSNVSFSAANGVTFYTSAGGAVVASVQTNYLTTARASNDAIGLNTAQTNVTWTVNSSGLSINAAGYAGTGTSKTGGAALTLNSNGLQFDGAALAGTTSGFTGANISASITHNTAGLAMSMSVAPPGAATLSVYAVSNTTQSSSGTIAGSVLSMNGAGGVSVGVTNGSIVVSGPGLTSLSVTGALSASSNGSTISLGVGTVTASIIGNTTQTSTGTVNLNALVVSAAGGVSAGISAGTLIISGATGGVGGGVGISAGTQSVSTGTMVFANSNGITFGMSGSSQVTASYNSTQFAGTGTTFAGANVSASMTLNSAGLNLSVSVAAPGAAAEGNNHNLLGNNTAGNTTASGSTIGMSGLNLTLSGANGSQIVFSAPATSSLVGASGLSISTNGSTISVYKPAALGWFVFEPPGASSAGSAMTQGSMSFQRLFIPENVSVTRVDVPVLISLASSAAANTGNLLISSGLVIYTVSGTSTLNPLVGAFGTTTYTHASNTANWNSVTGPRLFSFPIATMLTPGEYFVGFQLSTNNNSSIGTATTALAATISIQHGAIYTASQWAEFGAVTATSMNMRRFVGVAASVTATGQTQQLSNITQTGTALMRANIPVILRSY